MYRTESLVQYFPQLPFSNFIFNFILSCFFLYLKVYANEAECKKWCHERFAYTRFHTRRQQIVWTDNVNLRQSQFLLLFLLSFLFRTFFAAFFPSALSIFQENFPKSITSFDKSIPTWQANYPIVSLNVNLGQTLDKQIIFEKIIFIDRKTDKLRWPLSCLKMCFSCFHIRWFSLWHDLSVQTILFCLPVLKLLI